MNWMDDDYTEASVIREEEDTNTNRIFFRGHDLWANTIQGKAGRRVQEEELKDEKEQA